jgi:hypothetical protein
VAIRSQFENYDSYLQGEAENFFGEYKSDIEEDIKGNKLDVYNYFDDRVHEWTDTEFSRGIDLVDCALILDQSDNVETDSGLWEGQEPRKAIETQAFFTYRYDLFSAVKCLTEEYLQELMDKYLALADDVQSRIDSQNEKIERLTGELEVLDEDEDNYSSTEDDLNIERIALEELEDELEALEDILDNIRESD